MKLIHENFDTWDFKAWGEGEKTLDKIKQNKMTDELNEYVEEHYPNGITDTQLNDLLWHKADMLYDYLNIENPKNAQQNEINKDIEDCNLMFYSILSDITDLGSQILVDNPDIEELKNTYSQIENDMSVLKNSYDNILTKNNNYYDGDNTLSKFKEKFDKLTPLLENCKRGIEYVEKEQRNRGDE